MAIEQALIAQAQPYMVASRLQHIIGQEIVKGCLPAISPQPVALEPHFDPIWNISDNLSTPEQVHWTYENQRQKEDLVRLRAWISPDQELDWILPELFVKQLQAVSFRMGFEVAGNNKGITIGFLLHRADIPIITAAFNGEFELCELTPLGEGPIGHLKKKQWTDIAFRDYFPPPPYSHLLTRPQELHISPLTPLLTALSTLKAPSV